MRTIKRGTSEKDGYKRLVGEQVKCTNCGCVGEIETRDDIQKKIFNSGAIKHWSTICPECGVSFVILKQKIKTKKHKKKKTLVNVLK